VLQPPPAELMALVPHQGWYWLYAVNVFQVLTHGEMSYFNTLHLWSLSVEEQFYLLWPALIMMIASPRRHMLVPVLAAVTALSFAACVIIVQNQQPHAFYSPMTRAWEFGVGALACLSAARIARGWHAIAGAFLLLASAAVIDEKASTFPGFVTLLPVLGTAMLLLGGERANRVSAALSRAPLVWVGRLSYSIYLWHWPIIIIAGLAWPAGGALARAACVVATLLCATASYYLLENPVRTSSWAANRRRALSLGVGITGVGMVSATFAWWSANIAARDPRQLALVSVAAESSLLHKDPRHCIVPLLDDAPRRCDFLRGDGLVVLVGDSHAAQWFTPVMEYAKVHGMKLTTFVKSSCSVSDVPVFSIRLRRESPECTQWRAKLFEQLARLKPDLVIVGQFSASYLRNEVTKDDWAAGLARSVSVLGEVAKRVIVLSDTPAMGFDVPACLGRPTTHSSCYRTLPQAVALPLLEGEEASARKAGAAYLHVTDLFCTGDLCPATRGPSVLYRDANHITEAYARELTPVLVTRIADAAHPSRTPRP
jgi:peptidoglycan/LPS O-acetylase OafA/YrhL